MKMGHREFVVHDDDRLTMNQVKVKIIKTTSHILSHNIERKGEEEPYPGTCTRVDLFPLAFHKR